MQICFAMVCFVYIFDCMQTNEGFEKWKSAYIVAYIVIEISIKCRILILSSKIVTVCSANALRMEHLLTHKQKEMGGFVECSILRYIGSHIFLQFYT